MDAAIGFDEEKRIGVMMNAAVNEVCVWLQVSIASYRRIRFLHSILVAAKQGSDLSCFVSYAERQ
jgi:hypothetical protein